MASSQDPGDSPATAAGTTAPADKRRNLGQVTVHGQKLSPICILDTIKFALNRAYSTSAADADLVVCRFVKLTGSHLPDHLWCATNAQIAAQHLDALSAPRASIGSMMVSGHGTVSASLLATKLPRVNFSKMKTLMAKLPDKPLVSCS